MKFVKGDAIAGIVIIVINLLGGLAIGVMLQGMDLGAAVTKYSILTIGDGLVAQIPALLGAMAAGLIVTRTTDEDDKPPRRRDAPAGHRQAAGAAGGRRHLRADGAGARLPVAGVPGAGLAFIGFGVILTPAWRDKLRTVRHPAVRGLVKRLDTPQAVSATALPVQRPSVPLLLRVPASLLSRKTRTR